VTDNTEKQRFLEVLRSQGFHVPSELTSLGSAGVCLEFRIDEWLELGRTAQSSGWRLASLWADEMDSGYSVSIVLERSGEYLTCRACVPADDPRLPSLAGTYPLADRMERHARDLLGVVFDGHPDGRRWVRHQAWDDESFPLRVKEPLKNTESHPAPPDFCYPFRSIKGSGVCEVPVGPIHAGIIEPGHFRFQVVGEEILNLEERLGYVHKGIEKLAVGRDPFSLTRLAARVSGDSAVAHAWAACMAVEEALQLQVPDRAVYLRGVLAEIERVINHLWDIAAVCNDVAFPFAYIQLGRLVEDWRRCNLSVFGHRLLMDTVVPGGVARDLEATRSELLARQCVNTLENVESIWTILQDNASLHDRLAGTGEFKCEDARALGSMGYVGRASGMDFDVRRDAAYPPYDRLIVHAPSLEHGDVSARVRIRYEEVKVSLQLIERFLGELPQGEIACDVASTNVESEGLGIVEGWRGEIITYVRLDENGRIRRFFPRDPSWTTWPALERLIDGNIVPDFPVCNKSVNGSYSGHDL